MDLTSTTSSLTSNVRDASNSISQWLNGVKPKRTAEDTLNTPRKRASRESSTPLSPTVIPTNPSVQELLMTPSTETMVTIPLLPGAEYGDVVIFLQDNYSIKVDSTAIKAKSSWFFDKIGLYHVPDVACDTANPFYKVGSYFALPKDGKPILLRISRATAESLAIGALTPSSPPEALKSIIESPTELLLIKVEPSDDADTTSTISTQYQYTAKRRAEDRHAYQILFHLIHGSSLPAFTEKFKHVVAVTKLVIDLAKIYDCTGLLGTTLSPILHAYRQELFVGIKDDPARFVMLAARLEDSSIMKEALIHLIGCWPVWDYKTSQGRVLAAPRCSEILDFVERKAEELARRCQDVNAELFTNTLLLNEEPITVDSQESWLLVQFFRDWLCTAMRSARDVDTDRPDPKQRGDLYRKLRRGGDAYLPLVDVLDKFELLGIGYDRKELSDDLALLKQFARDAVEDLCKNHVMLDVEAHNIGHLTCATIEDEDLPWYGLSVESGR